MSRVVVVVNPMSGHGVAGHLSTWLRRRLRNQLELVEVGGGTDVAKAARQHAESGCERIVIIGGDGTFRSVAAALIGLDVPLGLVATGTNNNIARALGLPTDPYVATEVALSEDSDWITAGRVNGYVFFEETSIGLEARLWPAGEALVRHHVRQLLDAPIAIATTEPTAVKVELQEPDYLDTVAAYTMSISNIAVTGAHLPIAPGHDIHEPDLWLTVYHEMGPLGMMRSIDELMRHQPVPAQFVSRHPFKRARVSAADPLPVSADGTPIGMLPIEVEAIVHAVRVVFTGGDAVPSAAAPPPTKAAVA